MKNSLFYIFLTLSIYIFSNVTYAELAPRKKMSPLDQAKVHNVMSKRWTRFGATGTAASATNGTVTNDVTQGKGGSTGCITSIGSQTQQTNGLSSGRYGPSNNKDNIIAITGDIINICK